jgi:membrane-associated protease RseP (regulator of RpoE activity)
MNGLLTVVGWLIFLVGIGVSIALHEIGHLVPAKRFGVKVTQYMVGFGPTLWSKHRGETEYGVKAIPLGGYIRMIGMFPPEPNADGTPGDPTQLRRASTGRWAAMVDDARRTSLEEVAPADVDRVFYKLPVRRKIVVMLGGPVMNLVIAAFLFTIALVGFGLPTNTTLVGRVSECVPSRAQVEALVADPAATSADDSCVGLPPSPAGEAGLEVGDRIVEFGGVSVQTWEELSPLIQDATAGPVDVVVERDGARLDTTAVLVTAPRPTLDEETNEFTGVADKTFFGVAPTAELVPQPVTAVPETMWSITVQSARAIATLPVRLWELAQSTFGPEERDPNGLVGVVGVGRITGEVVAAEGLETKLKVLQVITLLAGLNLFLFLFNLIPLLPLDGGHVAGALWEGVKRRWARVRGRPDPGPVDVAKALPVAYAVSLALIAMSVLLIYADLVEPIRLGL